MVVMHKVMLVAKSCGIMIMSLEDTISCNRAGTSFVHNLREADQFLIVFLRIILYVVLQPPSCQPRWMMISFAELLQHTAKRQKVGLRHLAHETAVLCASLPRCM